MPPGFHRSPALHQIKQTHSISAKYTSGECKKSGRLLRSTPLERDRLRWKHFASIKGVNHRSNRSLERATELNSISPKTRPALKKAQQSND